MHTPETILSSGAVDYWQNASEEERQTLVLNRKAQFDPLLDVLAAEAGINGLPTLTGYNELRERFGRHVLYRGLDEEKHAQAFREGAYWPGRGTYGSGTYAVSAKRPTDALNYAERYYCGAQGAVLAMALALEDGAVVRTYAEVAVLRDEQKAAFAKHFKGLLAHEESNGTPDSVEHLRIRAAGAEAIYANLGRFMAAHGIDALYRDLPNERLRNGSYFLIVNRSKVIVAEGERPC